MTDEISPPALEYKNLPGGYAPAPVPYPDVTSYGQPGAEEDTPPTEEDAAPAEGEAKATRRGAAKAKEG